MFSSWVKKRGLVLGVFITLVTGLTIAVVALLFDIRDKKYEARNYPMMNTRLSEDDVRPQAWGQNFPHQLSSHLKMAEPGAATPYGGSVPYSKLIRYPQLTRLWAGSPFGADFNEERSHAYTQIDQFETKRVDKEWLNNHGFPLFKGQPGACMNCHSGWAPSLIRELGWQEFNSTPYWDLRKILEDKHGKGMHDAGLGGTCADCHNPKDMQLRVTRPGYINAMAIRGYEKDEEYGLKATRQEMRTHVCQQCHVEYYFAKGTNELIFPWSTWPKDEPFRIEMMETYYDMEKGKPDGFTQDWTHRETGAPMLKMQHPEAELFSSGIHARAGVACADCHMPYTRAGANKVTNHNIRSPLENVNASCQTCHSVPEEQLKARVNTIQQSTASSLRKAENAILALIDDIVKAKALMTENRDALNVATDEEFEAKVNEALKVARDFHRRSSMRWDFIASENSTGFHSPQESTRVLADSQELARKGQLDLVAKMQQLGLKLEPTIGAGVVPPPGEVIKDHHHPVGSIPSDELRKLDQSQ